MHFNVSHSGSRALIAFARRRFLGVDIEQIRENIDSESLARRYFSPPEQTALAALQTSERHRAFFRCWTRKEAYIKAHGAGHALPLHTFDVSVLAIQHNALLETRPDEPLTGQFTLLTLATGMKLLCASRE